MKRVDNKAGKAKEAGAKRLKVSIGGLQQMRDALIALESGDRVERGNAGMRIVREPFILGALRLEIAKNLRRIKDALDVFDQARLALIKECSGGKNVDHQRGRSGGVGKI
jgi:hypothetical protein